MRSWAKVLCCASIHAYQLSVHQSMHISFLCINPCISAFYAWPCPFSIFGSGWYFPDLGPKRWSTLLLRPKCPITGLMHIFIDPMVFGFMLYLRRRTSILSITTALCVWSKSLIICLDLSFKDLAHLPCGCLKITSVQLIFNPLRAEKHFEIDNSTGNNKKDSFWLANTFQSTFNLKK